MSKRFSGFSHGIASVLLLATTVVQAQVTPCVKDDLAAVLQKYNVDFATDIQPILDVACAGCHTNGGTSGGLSMSTGSAFGNLVNVPANNSAANMPRITPFNDASSFLFQKINCTNLNDIPGTPYGRRMPRSGPPYLSTAHQALILDWIEQGALAARDPDRIFGNGYDGRN